MEEPLDWLPMAPEIEDPEEPGWGQLEVRRDREVHHEGGWGRRMGEKDIEHEAQV